VTFASPVHWDDGEDVQICSPSPNSVRSSWTRQSRGYHGPTAHWFKHCCYKTPAEHTWWSVWGMMMALWFIH